MAKKIQIPVEVEAIVSKFQKHRYEIYIVGGAVRDILMAKAVYDWDFTTNATPTEMLKIFPDAFYDNLYGTVGIASEIEGNRPFEVTTYRTEAGYSDSRRPDSVVWGKSLEEDLQRRDFTINAMAVRVHSGLEIRSDSPQNKQSATIQNQNINHLITVSADIIDLYNGQEDLKAKLIKAVGDPNARFSEDALRMMRAVRIASELGFTIEEETLYAIQSNATLIHKIAKERVRDELLKILASHYPYEGMIIFRHVGLMEQILPEAEKTFGVTQKSPGRHHIYDVGTHSLMALKFCPSLDPIVRLATFIHDIGKPQTYKKLSNGTITFYNHEIVSTKIAINIAERLRFSNKQRERLVKLVRYHQFTVDERQTDSAIRRFIRHVGIEYLKDMLDLRVADRLGGGAQETSWRLEEFKKRLIEVQKQPFVLRDLKISGNDVMKILEIQPSPKVGEVLQYLFDQVAEGKLANDKDKLIGKLKEVYIN